MSDLYAKDIFELLDYALGTTSTAGDEPLERRRPRLRGTIVVEQALHDGRHRAREGDLLNFDRFGYHSGIKIFAGHNQLGPNRRCRECEAPCIGVKHRHDWQNDVARGKTMHICLQGH